MGKREGGEGNVPRQLWLASWKNPGEQVEQSCAAVELVIHPAEQVHVSEDVQVP